jgi:hypothetical protein
MLKHVAKTKRGVSQLRLQARGRSTDSGLAGLSLTRKEGFGLALPRADGEHPYARGRVASNRARDTGGHTPRRSRKTAVIPRLDQWCYWGKRERERERCVSSADASTYRPNMARSNLWHVCSQRTHAKTAPSPKNDPGPSPKETLYKRCKVDHQGRPKPDPMFARPPMQVAMTWKEHSVYNTGCQARTAQNVQTKRTKPRRAPARGPRPPQKSAPSTPATAVSGLDRKPMKRPAMAHPPTARPRTESDRLIP